MRCRGPPNGPCPLNKRGNDVELCQGDLPLCKQCEQVRFPSSRQQSTDNSESTTADAKTPEDTPEKEEQDEPPVIVDPVLCYIQFSLQSGTAENVRRAVLGHFSADLITVAKNSLWDAADTNFIGLTPTRRDSSVRTEKEADVQDYHRFTR